MISKECVKSVRIWSYSVPRFLAFGLNMAQCGPEQLQIRTLFAVKLARMIRNPELQYILTHMYLSDFGNYN